MHGEKELDKLTAFLKRAGSRIARTAVKKILASFLPVIGVWVLMFIFLVMLIAAVYSAIPQAGALYTTTKRGEDEEIKQHYQELALANNLKDTWLVEGESTTDNPYYPGTGKENFHQLVDRYGNDEKLRLKWGEIHAAALYRAFKYQEKDIPPSIRERIAEELHPYFYYKKSEVIYCGQDGCERETVYLLVEAYTIQGHYQYHYQWVEKSFPNGGSIRYEELKDTVLVNPNKWERLEQWIMKEFKVDRTDIDLARAGIWEAGQAFNEQKEWLDWLMRNRDAAGLAGVISAAMVPAELMPYFQEAEKKYGIPWWFLAAVAFKESSFNPQAVNSRTGCYGLMQVSPGNWNHYAPLLGFDPARDKDNPRAQILVGAYILKGYLGNVSWDGDWKNGTLPGLVKYGGFIQVPFGKPYNTVEEWCQAEYASIVWAYAEKFKSYGGGTVWPVPGYYTISSPFGARRHPVTGEWSHHDGIDIPAPVGTPVVSVSAGIVVATGYDSVSGNFIRIQDAVHSYSYCHLSEIFVAQNQEVQPGTEIGRVGSTGRSTGPHLHFGVRDLNKGTWIDSLLILRNNSTL